MLRRQQAIQPEEQACYAATTRHQQPEQPDG